MTTYYLVGGAVRDELMGVRSKDNDFAVEAESYDAMREDLVRQNLHIWQERPEFFTIRGKHPRFGDADFTLCRKEGFYSDNRHPDSVEVGTIHDDLARRDFTVNAIAKVMNTSEVWDTPIYIDPYSGRKDIEEKILRVVGSTDRFIEDPLRILRAVRFHIVRGFDFSWEVSWALQQLEFAALLSKLPAERIYEEMRKCYEHDSRATQLFMRKYPWIDAALFGNEGAIDLTPRIKEK